jgi:N-acetylated-alpha-linked acidic dipeptidase
VIAFWDGEEFGLIGSTEWMEKHQEELDQKLVAYINSDSSGGGRFAVNGSHSLEEFVQEIERDVNDPATNKPLLAASSNREFRIGALGSGSDYTPFLQHLGVASLDMRFGSEDTGVYHSDYDDYAWYSRFSDTTFAHGKALAQVETTALMRLADSEVVPFEFGRFVSTVRRYTDEVANLGTPAQKPDLSAVRAALTRLQKSAADLDAAYLRVAPMLGTAAPERVAALNRILYRTERAMTLDPGLPGRPWYRHRIYAPGQYTGYSVKTLPGVREAVEAGRGDEARQQALQLAQVLGTLDDQLTQAAALLNQLI